MAQISDQSDFLKTALRLPRDLHARIQKAAELSGRSMNAEIIARLQQTLEQPADAGALHEKISHLETRLRDAQQSLATESALASIVAISLKTLANNVPADLRSAIAADAAEAAADSVINKPFPRWGDLPDGSDLRAFVENTARLLEDVKMTARLMDERNTQARAAPTRRLSVRRPSREEGGA